MSYYIRFDTFNFVQCVCDWDDRENKFIEVEGILRRQIKVLYMYFNFYAFLVSFMLIDHSSSALI